MNSEPLRPENEQQIQAIFAEHSRLIAVGNRTKWPLSRCPDATQVSLACITGMIQYEPSEFTFTAHAGTRVSDVAAELSSRHQYLPFDPMLVQSGATLGGTVASGLAGPGRFRFGGVRDFLLGARLLGGDGRWTNVGGKVVKNAAGFDIPKLLVGSLGRFGLISELTFKVFPKPLSMLTIAIACQTDADAMDRIAHAASSRWELDAIEYRAKNRTVYVRLGGPPEVNDAVGREIKSIWGSDASGMDVAQAADFWSSINEMTFGGCQDASAIVVKVPTTPKNFLRLSQSLAGSEGIELHLSMAGATTWIRAVGAENMTRVREQIKVNDLLGLCICGSDESIWIGQRTESEMEHRVKAAMDPVYKFPSFDHAPVEAN